MTVDPKIPQPRQRLTERDDSVSVSWYRFWRNLEKRKPRTGTVTFAATNIMTVTLAPEQPDANYNVHFSNVSTNVFYGATSLAVTGFTANVSTAVTATVGFTIIGRV